MGNFPTRKARIACMRSKRLDGKNSAGYIALGREAREKTISPAFLYATVWRKKSASLSERTVTPDMRTRRTLSIFFAAPAVAADLPQSGQCRRGFFVFSGLLHPTITIYTGTDGASQLQCARCLRSAPRRFVINQNLLENR